MANLKDIRGRIASVKNIRKITRAMEMISAARLRRAEQRIVSLRPYASAVRRMTRQAAEAAENIPHLPILREHEEIGPVGMLLVTSDRGLAGAFNGQIIRAGIQSVSRGQSSAALALGMTYGQSMRYVILPQAFRNMIPLLLTQGVILFQDTSLVYVSALADFFGVAAKVGDRDGRMVELLLFAGAVYFVICYAISTLVKRYQSRLST